MDSLEALKGIIDHKIYKILRLFLDNKEELFHLNKISSQAKVPLASTFRIVRKLVRLNLITIVQVGKMKLYKVKRGKLKT